MAPAVQRVVALTARVAAAVTETAARLVRVALRASAPPPPEWPVRERNPGLPGRGCAASPGEYAPSRQLSGRRRRCRHARWSSPIPRLGSTTMPVQPRQARRHAEKPRPCAPGQKAVERAAATARRTESHPRSRNDGLRCPLGAVGLHGAAVGFVQGTASARRESRVQLLPGLRVAQPAVKEAVKAPAEHAVTKPLVWAVAATAAAAAASRQVAREQGAAATAADAESRPRSPRRQTPPGPPQSTWTAPSCKHPSAGSLRSAWKSRLGRP
eukprot:scaffold6767_cov223-Isochrysis_galbana.AAC.17